MATKQTVGVLMGGISPEHPVSLVSGTGMLKNLDGARYAGFPILISRDNEWIWPEPKEGSGNYGIDSPEQAAVCLAAPPAGWHRVRFPRFDSYPRCDVMLVGLHGVGGEDGRLQAFFELSGQAYTGSGSLGSALAMDKITAKRLYQAAGIHTARYRVLEKSEFAGKLASARASLEKEFGYPLVLKHPLGGSSIGMGIARDSAGLDKLLESLGAEAERLLAEEFIAGREGTCGVLDHFQPLAPTEIRPVQDGYFNFEAKYQPGRTEEITPAQFPAEVIARMQAIARKAHEILQLSVYSRTDFIYAENRPGPDNLFVLETNNLPGFTPTSLLPQAAAHAGLSYSGLLTKVIEESLARKR